MVFSTLSIPPYFLLSLVFLGIAKLIISMNSFYQETTISSHKNLPIEGLRGYLALGVFFHHSIIHFQFVTTGIWTTPNSTFYTMLGQMAVAFFFAITGYLFWAKVLNSTSPINWKKLYQGRARRIIPMYLFTVLIIIGGIFYKAHAQHIDLFENRQTSIRTVLQLSKYLIFSSPKLNVTDISTINAGVFWTLIWEWKFYFALPILVLLNRSKILLFGVLFSLCFTSDRQIPCYFVVGICCAELQSKSFNFTIRQKYVADVLFLSCISLLFYFFDSVYGFAQAGISFIAFYCLLNGNGLFGLLFLKTSRFLGEISYSIYLMHGIMISLVIFCIPNHNFHETYYWPITMTIGILTILASSLTYQFIEHYFYKAQAPVSASRILN